MEILIKLKLGILSFYLFWYVLLGRGMSFSFEIVVLGNNRLECLIMVIGILNI